VGQIDAGQQEESKVSLHGGDIMVLPLYRKKWVFSPFALYGKKYVNGKVIHQCTHLKPKASNEVDK